MKAARELADLLDHHVEILLHLAEALGRAHRVSRDLSAYSLEIETECDQALLRAVVQVSLDPSPRLVTRGDEARARGDEIFAGRRVRDRRRDKLGEALQARLGVVRKLDALLRE